MRLLITSSIVAGIAIVSLYGGQALAAAPSAMAHAAIAGTEGSSVGGLLEFNSTPTGVHISGTIDGLSPNSRHGFHVHENGDCSASDGKSAGGHFNPGNYAHGDPASMPHHAGDMPNIDADAKGIAVVDVTVSGVSLGSGPTSLLERAVIVHGKADDYTSQPSGDSGPRIACGVVASGK